MQPTCDPTSAFVVCGPVSAGNRMTAAALVRGGCSGEATAFHEWPYNCCMPRGPEDDPLPCLIRHLPFEGCPSVDDQLRARGYAPKYVYVVRDRTAHVASARRLGHFPDAACETIIRRGIIGMLRANYFELFPAEALMLGGNQAAAALCARMGLATDTSAPVVVDRIERQFENTDWKYWELCWRGDHGFYPVDTSISPYNDQYFEKYVKYSKTDLGVALTAARVGLVKKYWDGPVLDFGIGCGSFIDAHGCATGFDICPAAIKWLCDRSLFDDPWHDQRSVDVVTFWDSLEHVLEIDLLLERVNKYAFVSMPIFADYSDVCSSKHFRTDEHYWYFTRNGFVRFMGDRGFKLVLEDNFETRIGRESIGTFVFMRVGRGEMRYGRIQ